jgi:hypothetical protein
MKRRFDAVVNALSSEPGVSHGKMFASMGLKVGNGIFAMEVKGCLVVKLPLDRADELRKKRQATSFDPGHGRLMKQWVSVSSTSKLDWVALASEAMAYVRG